MSDHQRFSILCVCTGNICRSPVAERLLGREAGAEVEVGSAGTFGVVGAPISEPMARRLRAATVGADLAARRLRAPIANAADPGPRLDQGPPLGDRRALAGSGAAHFHPAGVRPAAGGHGATRAPVGTPAVRLRAAVPILATRRSPSPTSDDIDDPIGRPEAVYERVFGEIAQAVDRVAAVIVAPTWRLLGPVISTRARRVREGSEETRSAIPSAPRTPRA